jgi:hypothetical protein
MKTLTNLKLFLVSLVISSFFYGSCNKDGDTSEVSTIEDADYYVSLKGSDSNPGTLQEPFKTIEKAFSVAGNTDLIYVRGGTYPIQDVTRTYGLKLAVTGGPDSLHRLKIWAYPGERVVIDCGDIARKDDGLVGIYIESHNIHLKGFDVINVKQYTDASGHGFYNVGILVKGNNVLVENCTAHNNQGTGINLGGTCTGTTVLNCDSYDNYDPYTYKSDGTFSPGENADGFHITVNGLDATQKLVGCRAWNNSDDGYDCYNTDGYVFFDSCWSFRNGYMPNSNTLSEGNGAGFKLGATNSSYAIVKKFVRNCVATINKAEGFTQNNGRVIMYIYNNTAYNNGGIQFDFGNTFSAQAKLELKNNLAIGKSINYTPYAIHSHNTWDTSVSTDQSDFQSTDTSLLFEKRQEDGELTPTLLFRLASGSDLKNAGLDLGFGKNIGAF